MPKRTIPCDSCRARKTRCAVEIPGTACALCKSQCRACTYDHTGTKRRRISSLDENPRGDTSPLGILHATVPGTGVEEYDALPEGTTLLKRTLGLQNAHHSEYLGINNPLYADACISTRDIGRLANDGSSASMRYVHPDHAFKILPDSITGAHAWETPVLDAIEEVVQGHGKALVQLYFRIIHPSFPILHREVFLEKYARSYREFSPPLLAAVYLSASAYWTYSDGLATQPKPEMQPLKQLALDSLQMAMECAKLSTVQACLLISQYEAHRTDYVPGATNLNRTAQLVQLAHRLGLHLDAGDWDIPTWEIGLRRRLSWAVIMQDKWLAFVHGHPSFIQMESWDVSDLSAADFPEIDEDDTAGSSEVEKGRLVFAHMAELTKTLADAMITIFSNRVQRELRHAGATVSNVLDRIKPVQLQLKDWFTKLPPTLKMDTAANMKLSSVGYLRLAYLAVEASIHRVIVSKLSHEKTCGLELARICRQASTERLSNACDFFGKLSTPQLSAFWYMTSAECAALLFRFGQLLEHTTTEPEERATIVQMVKALEWSYKLHGQAGISFAKRALSIIQASSRLNIAASSVDTSL